jgi:hypothetical protein
VAQDIFASNGQTTTVATAHGIVTAGTSETWTVASSAGFPAAVTGVSQFRIADKAAPSEIMIVTNVSGTTWTVTRGAESTAPVAHSAGFTVYAALTAGVLGGLVVKPAATETIIYVSLAASASDSNDGLSWGSAKATIAGALTAIGGTTSNTNPGTIRIGIGSWTISSSQVVAGVAGFVIEGRGPELTKLTGPDAAPLFQVINCRKFRLRDLTYVGSPSGTGWGLEFDAEFSAGSPVGGVGPTECGAERVKFGFGGTCAYGVRWALFGGTATSDANNDEGVLRDCYFNNFSAAGISVEHSNSVQHTFDHCQIIVGGGASGIKFQGGSATIINPVFAGSSGWFIDVQPAAGNWAGHGADYYHPTVILGAQSEASGAGIIRSNTAASPQTFYLSPLQFRFVGGDLHTGNGVSNVVVDWENATSSFLHLSDLNLVTANPAAFNATSANATVTIQNCLLSLPTLACSGPLSLKGITYPVGSSTTISGNPIDYAPAVSPSKAVALTDATSIAVNSALGTYFRVTLSGNRTLANPTNAVDGRNMIVEVIQDATGSRTLAYDTNYAFSAGLPSPTLSTAASGRDFLGFKYNSVSGKWYLLAFQNGF